MLSEDDLAAITALRKRLRSSIVEGDAKTYTDCFAEDAVIMRPDSPLVRGRAAIAEYVAGMFEVVRVPFNNPAVGELIFKLTPVSVVGDGGLAFEIGVQAWRTLRGFMRERQHLVVYQRGDDGAWHVAAAAAMSGNQ